MQRFSPTRLRSARLDAQLRREQLAVAVERCTETICGYERGRVDPPASMVARLAEALNVEPGELFEPTDERAAG